MNYAAYRHFVLVLAAVVLAFASPSFTQEATKGGAADTKKSQQKESQQKSSQTKSPEATKTSETSSAKPKKVEVKGVIAKREADSFTLRDDKGSDVVVTLTSETQVKEKKSNPFRGGKNYGTTQLLRGLNVEVKGRPEGNGVVAEQIKFADVDLRMASSVESRVTPVEGRLGETETRLSQSEQNAQRLSGQIQELSSISNAARGGAKAAQETADAAITGVNESKEKIGQANQRISATNERISSLDDYDVKKTLAINFKVGSAVLSKEVQAELDAIAEEAKTDKGYIIEVTGFASADGGEAYNRRLSQRRADAVVQYMAENHNIPLRRIITPFGYGEKQPVADNATKEGRQQNRRVEVKILTNKGLAETAKAAPPATEPD